MTSETDSTDSPKSLSDIVEMLYRPDEHEKDWSILLTGGPADGGDTALSHFWGQLAYVPRDDGTTGVFESSNNATAITRDAGRTYEYHPPLVFPELPAVFGQTAGGAGGYNGPAGMVKMKSGKLGLTWSQVCPIDGNQTNVFFYFRWSDDDGRTWSEDVLVNKGQDKGVPYYDTLVQLESGRLIQPVRWHFWAGDIHRKRAFGRVDGEPIAIEGHGHHPEFEIGYCYFSDDDGSTWGRSKDDIIAYADDGRDNFITCDEPSLAQLPNGRLLMHMRTPNGRLFRCFSDDDGTIWSIPEPTQLAADGAPCALKRMPQTGDVLCVWNQASGDEIRRGLRRNRLSAAVTSDGITWKHFRTVDWAPSLPEGDYIAPEDKPRLVRAEKDVGELPEDWGFSTYPTIGFAGEEVIISYSHGMGCHPDKVISKLKHRILPVQWFYKNDITV